LANLWFSVFAGVASALVSVGAVLRGAPVVAIVFGLLAVGFVARATENRWRPRR